MKAQTLLHIVNGKVISNQLCTSAAHFASILARRIHRLDPFQDSRSIGINEPTPCRFCGSSRWCDLGCDAPEDDDRSHYSNDRESPPFQPRYEV